MKLLFITPQVPFPAQQGTAIRNYNLIRQLSQRHTIDLLSFHLPANEPTPENPLYEICRRFRSLPQPQRSTAARIRDTLLSPLPDMAHRLESSPMRLLIEDWIAQAAPGEWDIVQIEGIEVAQYGKHILDGMRCKFASRPDAVPRLIFDNHNCEYLLQKRNALNDLQIPLRLLGGLYSAIQWLKLRRYEKQVCLWADAVAAVSVADKQALQELVPEARIDVVPNGIDPHEPTAGPAERVEHSSAAALSILYTGKMDYRPNVDAMLWFGKKVFPQIRTRFPDAVLDIVGMNPHPRLSSLQEESAIVIHGRVDSLTPFLEAAAVCVIPLRVGGGTRLKALEAMAHGKAIVTTSLGIEGVPVVDKVHLLVADGASGFADAVIHLLEDRKKNEGTLAKALGRNARKLVVENYSWDKIIPALEELYSTPFSPISGSGQAKATKYCIK